MLGQIKVNHLRVAILAAGIVGANLFGAEEPDFPPARPVCMVPAEVAMTDHDRDGRLDLLLLGGSSACRVELGVARGDGRGGFDSCWSHCVTGCHGLGPPCYGDFNEDGSLDVLGVDPWDEEWQTKFYGRIVLCASEGDSFTCSEIASRLPMRTASVLAVADLDSDGHLDFAFGNSTPFLTYIQTWTGDGWGTFWQVSDLELPNQGPSRSIELADMDGDGAPDMVVQFDNYPGYIIRVYRNDGFLVPLSSWTVLGETQFEAYSGARMKLADLTGDGALDLIVTSGGQIDGQRAVTAYTNEGDGTFSDQPLRYPVSIGVGTSLVADFDEDGLNDVVVHGEMTFQVLLSSEQFQTTTPHLYLYRADFPPFELKAGDFDLDGHLDIVIPQGGDHRYVVIVRGNGDGTFEAPSMPDLSRCGQYGGAKWGDFNEDGTLDLIASNYYSGEPSMAVRGQCVLLGRPGAVAEPFFDLHASYAPPLDSLRYGGSVSCAGDFNGDRHQDLVLTYSLPQGHPSGFFIRFGRGDGSFGNPSFVAVDQAAGALVGTFPCGDFDSDGVEDLFARYWKGGVYSIAALRGAGDGTFAAVAESGASDFMALTFSDFDGDGILDAVGITRTPPSTDGTGVAISRGLGGGVFGTQYTVICGLDDLQSLPPDRIFLDDFNRDGRLDIGVHCYDHGDTWTDAVAILLARPDGSFADPTVTVLESDKRFLTVYATGDVNADGICDIVICQSRWVNEGEYDKLLSVLYGYGDGTFTPPQLFAHRDANGILLRDMNGDGLLDFVLTGGGWVSPGLEVILQEKGFELPPRFRRGDANADGGMNIADAAYVLQYLFAQGPAIHCTDAADANDDGAVDLADGIYILQNLFANGPAIPPPYPDCGIDPTADELDCAEYQQCEP